MLTTEKIKKILDTTDRLHIWKFCFYDVARILHSDVEEANQVCLQLVEEKILGQINDEYFYVLNSPFFPKYPLEECITMLRETYLSYISFETMLYRYNMLPTAPEVMTVATFGESGCVHLPFGTILFTHVDDSDVPMFYAKNTFFDPEINFLIATPGLAYEDYYAYRTNPEEIDKEDLDWALETYPSFRLPDPVYTSNMGLIL